MMEFTFEEAETLLTKNLKTATENLGVVEQQLSFLRDQITTSEVGFQRPKTLRFEVVQTALVAIRDCIIVSTPSVQTALVAIRDCIIVSTPPRVHTPHAFESPILCTTH
jgi:hypothetical protein